MTPDDTPPDVPSLLRSAAAGDVATARTLLTRIDGIRLLELVVTQAELAVDEERDRAAGIDAVGDLGRAAIEVMGLPQDITLEDEDDEVDPDELPPTVTGWELVTTSPAALHASTLTLDVPTWALALVAFRDHVERDGGRRRRTVAVTADGRIVAAQLHLVDVLDEATLEDAQLTTDPACVREEDASLAAALQAAMAAAAGGALG